MYYASLYVGISNMDKGRTIFTFALSTPMEVLNSRAIGAETFALLPGNVYRENTL